jgi:hypothetical protein
MKFFNKSFSSRLYSSTNLKFQKQFKFSTDKQYKEDRDTQAELFSINKDINLLKEKIKNEKAKVYYNSGENVGMKENQADRAYSVMKLHEQLEKLQNRAKETSNKLYKREEKLSPVNPELRYLKEQIVRKSLIHDVYSSNYNYQNIYLNPLNYINRYTYFESRDDKQIIKETNILEEALESEIKEYVDATVYQDLGKKSIDEIMLTNRPFLKDSDTKIQYDSGVETNRLFETTNLSDDFSTAFSEEKQIRQKVSREDTNDPVLNNSPDPEFNRDYTLINKIRNNSK